MSEMSSSQDSLKMKLDQLECHVTWDLNKDDLDLHNLHSRLEEQVRLDLPGAARALCSLGYVEFLLEHTQEALINLLESEILIKENPNCEKSLIVTYGNLAWVYFHRENFPKCQSYLEKLEKITQTLPTEPSSVPEVLHEKGWAFLKFSQKYYPQAKEVFQKAVELDPDNSELNAGYAHALYRTEPDISCTVDSPAVNQLRRAIDLNPDVHELKVLLAIKLLSFPESFMNEPKMLVETLNDAPEHPHVMRYAGKFFREHGYLDRAIEILKQALSYLPNSCFIHHQLGVFYKTKKIDLNKKKQSKAEIDKARNQSIYHLEMATQLKPSFIVAMSALAVQYGERGELKEAEELFEKVFETAKEKNEYLSEVNFDYAQFQQYSNRCEDLAIKHYKECLTMYPRTGESKKSAWKLLVIAQECIKHNQNGQNDEKTKEILELLQLTVEKHLKHNPNDQKAKELQESVQKAKGEMSGDTRANE